MYVSKETGRNEVFVADCRLDAATATASARESQPISTDGGFSPRWSADGGELFYLTGEGTVLSVGGPSRVGRCRRCQTLSVRCSRGSGAADPHCPELASGFAPG